MQTVLYTKKVGKTRAKIFELQDESKYKMNTKTKQYEQIEEELTPFDQKMCLVNTWKKKYEKNILQKVEDIEIYRKTCFEIANIVGLSYDFEFFNIKILCRSICQKLMNEKPIIKEYSILESIDEASGGGSLLCNAGDHKGQYTCFDLNNSYNAFFIENSQLPSDPEFTTIKEIPDVLNEFAIYRLKTKPEDKISHLMKLNRKWYTHYDIQIFRHNNVYHELINEPNNCIMFKKINCDMKKLNCINDLKNTKQKDSVEKNVYKYCLSSLWGSLVEYDIVEESKGVLIDNKYYLKCSRSNVNKFKNPQCIYKYSTGIFKPFILAYGRMKLLEQLKKCYDEGYEILYCHTDSIICDASPHIFNIGEKIGQWKIEKVAENGVKVINMATKEFY